MYNIFTGTSTFTVIDIRKTFEGFEADLRMIARRTGKMDLANVEAYVHDILKWAENKYVAHIDITLLNNNDVAIKAVRYKVNENGTAISGERAGGNDWVELPDTTLTIFISYNQKWHNLSAVEKSNFQRENRFKASWSTSTIDTSYNHLTAESAQLYASKGYELKKQIFR